MAITVYIRNDDPNLIFERPLKPGEVMDWTYDKDCAVVFGCPCGEREVYVTSPPHHKIRFNDSDLLTIEPSVLSPKHGCHFFMHKGRVKMCGDSTCPGAEL